MQVIDFCYYENKKVRFSFNFLEYEGFDTLREFTENFSPLYIRVEHGKRIFVVKRKSKHSMQAISCSKQIVQDEVLKGLKMLNCTFPRVFKIELVGDRLELTSIKKGYDDGSASWEHKSKKLKEEK